MAAEVIDRDWEDFKKKFNAKSQIDLNQYKPAQMQRRITNLMARHNVTKYMDFLALIDKDEALFRYFIDYLTINVTEFFRTPEKFVELEQKVIPDLMKQNPNKLKIWSAGCSTGAEPYSMSIMMSDVTPRVKHPILASDLDVKMLAKAKEGIYHVNELKNVSPARLTKYFKQVDAERYGVTPDVKEGITFQHHNLLLDKYDSNFDLISCRNVVIYFTEEAKDILYRRFLEALRPGGVLFVGGTEAILNFREIGFQHYLPFFYRKPLK
jgi:chemotaxis protein methyltransferase CheR